MLTLKNSFLLSICFSAISNLFSHQPDISATSLINHSADAWILQVSGALTGFEYVVDEAFGSDSYTTPELFNKLVLKHLKDNIDIILEDGEKVSLQNGQVKLGHETNVVFELVGMPETITQIKIKNSSFKNIHNNQSALRIIKDGYTKTTFTLNNENNHQVKLRLQGNIFINQDRMESSSVGSNLPYLFGAVMLSFLIMFTYFFFSKKIRSKKKRRKVSIP